MIIVDEINSKRYVQMDDCFCIELPLVFRLALGIHTGCWAMLCVKDGVLSISKPGAQAPRPGAEAVPVDPYGRLELPEALRAALNLSPGGYLKMILHQSERCIAAEKLPFGCILCGRDDALKFHEDDIICDDCIARIEQNIKDELKAEQHK